MKIMSLDNLAIKYEFLKYGVFNASSIADLSEVVNSDYLNKMLLYPIESKGKYQYLYQIMINDNYSIITDDGKIKELFSTDSLKNNIYFSSYLDKYLEKNKFFHFGSSGVSLVINKGKSYSLSQNDIDYLYRYFEHYAHHLKTMVIDNNQHKINGNSLDEKDVADIIADYEQLQNSFIIEHDKNNANYPINITFNVLNEENDSVLLKIGCYDKKMSLKITDDGDTFNYLKSAGIDINKPVIKRTICNIMNKYLWEDSYSTYYDSFVDAYHLEPYGNELSVECDLGHFADAIRHLLECIQAVKTINDIFNVPGAYDYFHTGFDSSSIDEENLDDSLKPVLKHIHDNNKLLDNRDCDIDSLSQSLNQALINQIPMRMLDYHLEVNPKYYRIIMPTNLRYTDKISVSLRQETPGGMYTLSDNGKTLELLRSLDVDMDNKIVLASIENILENTFYYSFKYTNTMSDKASHKLKIKHTVWFSGHELKIKDNNYSVMLDCLIRCIERLNVLVETNNNIY